MTKKEIMENLKSIRYYYARRQVFFEASKELGNHELEGKIMLYNETMKTAPIRLYDLYIELYLNNNTQESLAEKWGYVPQTIRRWNALLYKYLYEKLQLS